MHCHRLFPRPNPLDDGFSPVALDQVVGTSFQEFAPLYVGELVSMGEPEASARVRVEALMDGRRLL